jgi:hypothetical protein
MKAHHVVDVVEVVVAHAVENKNEAHVGSDDVVVIRDVSEGKF